MRNSAFSRKYAFHWELLGDLHLGRPNMGPITSLHAYRLMQYRLMQYTD